MRVFVRDLSGHSLSFETTSLSSLRYSISEKTGVPTDEQRLVYGGRQMEDSQSLESYGLVEGATIGLVLRLRGGGPKKRCAYFIGPTEKCSSASIRIVGDCPHCSASFCGRHRLPEDHACSGLASCREAAFAKNKSTLEAERTSSNKGVEAI